MKIKVLALSALMIGAFSVPALAQNALPSNPYAMNKEDARQFNALPPAQQNALLNKAYDSWNTMSPQERDDIVAEAQAKFKSFSPDEQKQFELDALKKWNAMSPQEQQQLRDTFPGLLRGDLVTN